MAKRNWQLVVTPIGDEESPGVRRFPVPGGWLYQVENSVEVDDLDAITRVTWCSPVFVPFSEGDGHE